MNNNCLSQNNDDKTSNNSACRRSRLGTRFVLLAAILVLPDFRPEELGKELAGMLPVFAHDAVFHFGGFNLPLYKSGILQFLQMLAYRGLCDGQFLMNVAKIASLLFGKELQDSNPCRMSHCFGKSSNLFLLCCVLFLFHFNSLFFFIVRKTTNNILNGQIIRPIFFGKVWFL